MEKKVARRTICLGKAQYTSKGTTLLNVFDGAANFIAGGQAKLHGDQGNLWGAYQEIDPEIDGCFGIHKAYFAEKKKNTYTVKSGDSLSKIAAANGMEVSELKKLNDIPSDNNMIQPGQKLKIVSNSSTDKEASYTPLDHASIGDEVYIVVEYFGKIKEGTVLIKEKEKILSNDGILMVLQDDNPTNEIRIKPKKDELDNCVVRNIIATKIKLRPKNDENLKEWVQKLEAQKDKKDYLYLVVDFKPDKEKSVDIFSNVNPEKEFLKKEKQYFEMGLKQPIIVIDPGHGIKEGNVGAQSPKFIYKLKDLSTADIKLNENNEPLTKQAWVKDLPEYVFEDISKWIVGSVKNTYDPNVIEYQVVYDVSLKLQEILKEKDYKVYLTRDTREVVSKGSAREALAYRVRMAIDEKADYFISIHADGDLNTFTKGASTLCQDDSLFNRKVDQDRLKAARQLSTDILKFYNIVSVKGFAKQPDKTKYILRDDINSTKRKTLVEIGHLSNPEDAYKIINNIDQIASQLAQGIEYNIKNEFYENP